MSKFNSIPNISKDDLRDEFRKEYASVALDPFEGVPNPSSALDFGTQGVSLRANKHS